MKRIKVHVKVKFHKGRNAFFAPYLLFLLIFHVSLKTQGQWISINESGTAPNESAALDISSNSKGVLISRMSSIERLAINNPKQGLLIFQEDGVKGFYFFNGTVWDTLGASNTIVNTSSVTNEENSGIALLRDVKAVNLDGGTFNSGDWRKRDLNSLIGDLSFIDLDSTSSEFTLDTGTYVIQAKAPALSVDQHQARLYNISSGADVAYGSMAHTGNLGAVTISFLNAVLTVSSGPETFILQHRSDASNLGDGFGRGSGWGESVFSEITIRKL